MRVIGDGEDEEDEQVRRRRRPRSHRPATCSSHPLDSTSRHPTPPAAAIYTSQGLRSSSCSTVSRHGEHHPNLWTTSLLLTTYHISAPPAPSHCHVWASLPFTSARSSPRLAVFNCQSAAEVTLGPAAASAAATPPLPTSPNPTIAPPTSTHQPTSTLPLHYPRYTHGQRPGSSPGR